MDLNEGVAMRVAALCLDAKGRPSERLVAAAAVRAGILIDLAVSGRLESTDDSIVIDEATTGFPPADRLLAAIAVEPERSLDGWLDERRIGLRDVVDAAVLAGRWQAVRGLLPGRQRYVDLAVDQTTRDRARDPNANAETWSPEDAAVTAIALVAGLLRRPVSSVAEEYGTAPADPVPEVVLTRAGRLRWLCEAVTEHLAEIRARDLTAAAAFRDGGTIRGPLPY